MSDEPKKVKELKLEIHADEDIANGIYSNFVIANQSETEFTFDFVFVQPQSNKAKVQSRIIMNPIHAKKLAHMLNNQVEGYEKLFGEIPMRRTYPGKTSGPDDGGDLLN